MPRRQRLSWSRSVLALLGAAVALIWAIPACAQIAPPPPLKRLYGVGDDEFFKGAWMKVRPDTAGAPDSTVWAHAGQFWEVADRLGVNILRIQGRDFIEHGMIDSMIAQRTDTLRQRLITAHLGANFEKASVGREVRFYPFTGRDSVEYRSWQTRFMRMEGGTTEPNPGGEEKDVYGQVALEQHYRQGALRPGTVVASDIDLMYFPAHRYGWPRFGRNGREILDDSVQNRDEFLRNAWQFINAATGQFVVVTGHLFERAATARPDESILKIEVIYEIPKGRRYVVHHPAFPFSPLRLPYWENSYIADTNTERTLATFFLRRGDLLPADGNYNRYREVAFRFDARWASDSTNGLRNTGPLYPGNESRRINLRVTWIGSEDIAIRSIALRDSLGQLLLGSSERDAAGRAALLAAALHEVRRMVTLDEKGIGEPRWPIIAVSPHIESHPMHGAAFNLLTRFIQDNVQGYDRINRTVDSITVWNETDYNESLFQRWNEEPNPRFLVPNAVVPEVGIKTFQWLDVRLKLRNGKIPSIAPHNGGRFTIPLLPIEFSRRGRDAIEYEYESTLQLLGFRQNVPYPVDEDVEFRMQIPLARAAAIARDTRRRLIIVPFCVARLHINFDEAAGVPKRDYHTMVHLPEPAELRTMMNLGLCYGARGVLWQIAEAQYNFIDPNDIARDEKGIFRYGYNDDFGVHTPLVREPNLDYHPEFGFLSSVGANAYHSRERHATIRNFFTGWNIRTRAVRDIHRWIDQVGPSLMKLDWREGYSMHFTVPQPYDTEGSIPHRPLDTNEIVASIRTRYPGASDYDDAARTFVELGLFYTKNATADPLRDTNHIFLVNRRCFERTDDFSPDSDTGRTMEMLAETRTIEVRLNISPPVARPALGARPSFVRIREIAPDTARLPLARAPRQGLDTIVHVDSAFALTLGPGRAALLRITWTTEDGGFGSLEKSEDGEVNGTSLGSVGVVPRRQTAGVQPRQNDSTPNDRTSHALIPSSLPLLNSSFQRPHPPLLNVYTGASRGTPSLNGNQCPVPAEV